MCCVMPTKEIKKKEDAISPYRARSKEEDRGDLFIVGTPDYILEYNREVMQFYRNASTDSKGRNKM